MSDEPRYSWDDAMGDTLACTECGAVVAMGLRAKHDQSHANAILATKQITDILETMPGNLRAQEQSITDLIQ